MPVLPLVLGIPLVYFVIGLFVWWRAPGHPVARRMLAVTTVLAMLSLNVVSTRGTLPPWGVPHDLIQKVLYGLLVVLSVGLVALLPDGRPHFTYERVVLGVLWLLPLDPLIAFLDTPVRTPLPGEPGLWLFLVGPVLLVVRYAWLPANQRRVLRWLLGMSTVVVGVVMAPVVFDLWVPWVSTPVLGLLAVAVSAAALVVTTVRHRLLGVDLGIGWTTRYGLLWLIFGVWLLALAAFVSAETGTFLPIAAVVFLVIAAYVVRLSVELAARVAQTQRQAEEVAASRRRIVQAQDSERRRIERRLHDGIQQELVILVAKLRLARNKLPPGAGGVDATLAEVQDDTYRVIDDLRELSHGIHPAELSDQGLVAAVRSRARRAPIPVTVTAEPPTDTVRYAIDIEETAYFLVSEALTNVFKHAHASHATIRFGIATGSLVVEVTDDGIGIPDDRRDGSGLTGLRDRIAVAGGDIRVTSDQHGGTTVRARLPAREGTDG